jgi:hypothetical protein
LCTVSFFEASLLEKLDFYLGGIGMCTILLNILLNKKDKNKKYLKINPQI